MFCINCNGSGATKDPVDGYVKTCPVCGGYGSAFLDPEPEDIDETK
jgi:DnaJ-class molecular chaperone